ncbi:NuoI/complex I 23 kDa subunit family protein [Geminisphaera colitermitum]|uniref:NuoI/complex I 23 kDa subunit family protein n=1 Tax=Geminisphaera colitermitum TaxID=1148786 RepID=UPI000158D519|nr:NADH-quinone oxidoreductase subunit I [Geminisphaera colitermitum]
MFGTGILKGLVVTAKNFAGSYHDPRRLTTVQYPEQRTTLPENFRSFPFLVFDEIEGKSPIEGLRCVACKICEKECPPQCIYIVPERDEKGKALKKPAIFDIDFSVCMGCGLCAESCPFDSIKMDHHYEITANNRYEDLLVHRDQLAKSNAYYNQIHPTEAAAVDAALAEAKRKAEERAAAAKARVGASLAKPAPAASAPAHPSTPTPPLSSVASGTSPSSPPA